MAADAWRGPQGLRVRAACFERDRAAAAPCIWCGGAIDYGKGPYRRGGDVWAWSPEHVLPRDRWPELALDPANIRAAHFHCNASRKDKAGISAVGKRTRSW